MRKLEQEKQEELDIQAKRASEMANRARIEADQRMKKQEARYKAIRLNAEANILENVERDPESLQNNCMTRAYPACK